MQKTGRRAFLGHALVAAGYTGLAAGMASAVAPAEGQPERDTPAAPPSGRFLDAVREGDLAAVRQALAVDAGLVHSRDGVGRTAFALALLHRHAEIAELLRERGHNIDLHEAALALDWKTYEPMAERSPGLINQDHPIGGTAMYAAAHGGAGRQIWRVYRYGGLPNEFPRGDSGHSALQVGLRHPDLGVAEMTAATLLSNGASVEGPGDAENTPLHIAAGRGSVDLVEMLIRKGAAVNAQDSQGRTALQRAEEAGHTAVAEMLRDPSRVPRDNASSRRAYDADGAPYAPPDLTDLSLASRLKIVGRSHRDLDAVRADLERRPGLAHSVATTTEGAVEAGAHMGRPDIVDVLLEHGAPMSLPTAAMHNNLKRARALLDEEPLRIHERGAHDFPLLWYPVIGKGLTEMAELLLSRGAQVERQHWMGTTALHYAALGGQADMVALLLEHGADPQRVGRKFDDAGHTALDLAEARGHEDVAKLLRGS